LWTGDRFKEKKFRKELEDPLKNRGEISEVGELKKKIGGEVGGGQYVLG